MYELFLLELTTGSSGLMREGNIHSENTCALYSASSSTMAGGRMTVRTADVSSATTLNIYTHVTGEMQRNAARNIDQGIAGPPAVPPWQAAE